MALKRLDLSFNKIRKIGTWYLFPLLCMRTSNSNGLMLFLLSTERLQDLLSLEYLDLRANSISSVNDLDELQQVLHTFSIIHFLSYIMLYLVAARL